ncbi:VOC family protein [Heyndrickxia sp. NPDC080065]|uniref:VOC family protein n=1 Tax=Heyndrickxia sp. NPDC080065 TaxID=3390568 RepID=UPI003CFEE47E
MKKVKGGKTIGEKLKCSPVKCEVASVILWSRDLKKSVDLYSKLLGLPIEEKDNFRTLHIFRLSNGLEIMIDSNGMNKIPVPQSASPLFFMPADDIDKAADYVHDLGFEIIYGGIHRNHAVSFFNMRDEDFNVITICQKHK